MPKKRTNRVSPDSVEAHQEAHRVPSLRNYPRNRPTADLGGDCGLHEVVARRGWAEGCVELGEFDPGREATTKSICSSPCPCPPSAFSSPPLSTVPVPTLSLFYPPNPFHPCSVHHSASPIHLCLPSIRPSRPPTDTRCLPEKARIISRSYPNAPPRHRTWPAQDFVPPPYSTHSETSSLGNQCPTSIGALDPHQQAPRLATSPSSHRTTQLKHQAGPSPRSHLFKGSSVTVKMQKSLLLAMNDLYT